MKTYIVFVYIFCASVLQAAIPMSRVVGVADSRTLIVEVNGVRSAVSLAGVSVEPGEESAATAYLHQIADRTWVYIENGIVYRSPDGLYVNGEMQRRAWRTIPGMRYLGESIAAPSAATPQVRSAKGASPAAARSRAPLPRARSRRRR